MVAIFTSSESAAKMLIDEGTIDAADIPETDGYRAPTSDFIDGIAYDGHQPNAYIDSLTIGLKTGQTVSGTEVVSAN